MHWSFWPYAERCPVLMLPMMVLTSGDISSHGAAPPSGRYNQQELSEESRSYIMRVRSISVSLIIPLMTLCMLIGFNLLPPLMAHAASKPRPQPAKDSLQILPKKLAKQSTIPANTISLYESTTNAVTMYNQGCRAAPVPRTSLSVLAKVTITLVIHSPSQPPRGMPMVSNGAIWSTLCKALSQTITTLSWVPTEPATWRWSGRTLH